MHATQLKQDVHFCTASDGVRIAYATLGSGPPLLKAANWLSHLEYDFESPVWRHWLRELSRDHTLVRYDERGCGLSDWDAEENSYAAWVRDLEAVVDATGLERFPLIGISQGGPVAIEYAMRHPDRVSHLILYGTYARGWQKRNDPPEKLAEREALIKLSESGWGSDVPVYRDIFSKTFIPEGTEETRNWFSELQRKTCSPENAVKLQRALGPIDVTHLLPHVKVPTLVLHARGDLRCPYEEARLIAAGIPGSRLVTLESRNHMLLEHEPAWQTFLYEVRSFLGVDTRPTPSAPPPRESQSLVASFKQKKLVQWGIGYLTVAWVALQVLGEVNEPWNLPTWVMQAAQITLLFGFVVTMVLAWFHGLRGKQKTSATEVAIVGALVVLLVVLLFVFV